VKLHRYLHYICKFEQQRSEAKLIETTVNTLTPVRTLTTKLQEGALTPGKTLGHWQLNMLSQEHISTPLATVLMKHMKERENHLDSTSVGCNLP